MEPISLEKRIQDPAFGEKLTHLYGQEGAGDARARCAAVRHSAGGACPDASGLAEVCEAEAQCPSASQSARGSCAPAGGAGRLRGSSESHRSSGAGRGRKRRKGRSGRKEVLPQQAWIPP